MVSDFRMHFHSITTYFKKLQNITEHIRRNTLNNIFPNDDVN